MMERVWLVMAREFGATILSRAFVMMVLAPVISLLAFPIILFGAYFVVSRIDIPTPDEAEQPVFEVELVDPLGIREPLAEALPNWKVVEPEAGAEPLSGEAVARIELSEASLTSGDYRLFAKGRKRDARARARPLEKAVDHVLGDARLQASALDVGEVREALTVKADVEFIEPESGDVVALFKEYQHPAMGFGALFVMLSALSIAGQGLLTSTLEEKTTRVAEVLLGAVSPVELLTGKVFGHLLASLVLAVLWSGPTLALLFWFASVLVGPGQLLALALFIAIASLSWASVMGGVGSAINDLTEAQQSLAPLFFVMMLGFVPAMVGVFSPTDPVVVLLSMVPPTAPPAMVARMLSETPPPVWQVLIALVTSGVFAAGLLWAAGRLFRIGLLLHGAPPNLRTLAWWIWEG